MVLKLSFDHGETLKGKASHQFATEKKSVVKSRSCLRTNFPWCVFQLRGNSRIHPKVQKPSERIYDSIYSYLKRTSAYFLRFLQQRLARK